ncbi:16S rRNA processing protein RimM [Seinonella peptonophila]|uniref:Ribosome maturation factor RimM n=1 Tax=Seinonella peptonophila TaxID=112248 RepID=A0A1M4USQ3_9BACL|nr:ribosome maturation factor RimM [Seinonella peptonophila]SHE59771.1 16S rRNA processing protein RimM [Seinonella peptonophila]
MMSQPEFLRVGQIVTTHGLRGDVRVRVTTDYPEFRFATGAQLIATHPNQKENCVLTVEKGRPHKNLYLVSFSTWNHIDEAKSWIGGELMIPIDEAITEDHENSYYYHELIGCQVVTTDGKLIGEIREILPNPANDLFVVQPQTGKKIYLPFIEEIVKEVDPSTRQVKIEWMEGLD